MVGQVDLLDIFKHLIEEKRLPQFTILEGIKGSGKKTFIREFLKEVPFRGYTYWLPDVKVDTMRKMIEDTYKLHHTLCIIEDADGMSLAAQNALLKVTEEPPNDAHYILTVEDRNNLIGPILSRGSIYMMERYKPEELIKYGNDIVVGLSPEEKHIIQNVCEVPAEVELLCGYGIEDFYNYVSLVVDDIANVSGANALKISSKIAFKDEDAGYNLKLFWKVFCSVSMDRFVGDESYALGYLENIKITGKVIQQLRYKGVNKQMLFDMWVLDIRKVWMQ